MISYRTVLVVGAGGSKPYGFFTGEELYLEIVGDNFAGQFSAFQGYTEEFFLGFREFQQALKKSGRKSVDAFLEYRPEFVEIGKFAIAVALTKYETEGWFYERSGHQLAEHWYQYLMDRLSTPPGRFRENQLSVLTFNYDRSLEFYMRNSLQNSFKFDRKQVDEQLENTPIIHLHGQFGSLEKRPYGFDANNPMIQEAAAGIRIVHETDSDSDAFKQAHNLLRAADRIYFVGFGYGETNLQRLGVDRFRPEIEVYGSAMGLKQQERNRIQQSFGSKTVQFGAEHWGAMAFFRESPALDDRRP